MKVRSYLAIAMLSAMTSALKVKTEANADAEYFLPGWVGRSERVNDPYDNAKAVTTSGAKRSSYARKPKKTRTRRTRSYSSDSDTSENEIAPVTEPEIYGRADPIVHPEAYVSK